MARARVTAATARVSEARARLERLTIRAPIDGEILQLKYRVGEYYAPGAEALVVMGDTRTLRVRVDIDERDIPKLSLDAQGFATLNAFPGRRVPGHVVELGKRMGRKNVRTDDPVERIDTKILEVLLELDDKAGLVPGLRVTGYIAAH
jgi:multidrug resistance efflux pump